MYDAFVLDSWFTAVTATAPEITFLPHTHP